MKSAQKHNVALIPFGNGTNVTHCLSVETNETRSVASIDVSRMNHIKWINKSSMLACVEAG